MFLEISQNSLEATCARVSFRMKKRHSGTGVFLWIFAKFLRTPFLQNTWWLLLNSAYIRECCQTRIVPSIRGIEIFCLSSQKVFSVSYTRNLMKLNHTLLDAYFQDVQIIFFVSNVKQPSLNISSLWILIWASLMIL